MRCNNFSQFLLVLALGLCPLLAGCGTSSPDLPLDQRPVRVVTTTTMITDAVRLVGGSRLEVTGLMEPGTDPHGYEARAGAIKHMEKADLIFYNGLHLEGKMGETFAKMRGNKTVAVTDGIPREMLRKVEEFEGGYDPHVWFEVPLWAKVVEHIRDKLIEIDPTHAETYRANAKPYLEELTQVHAYVKTQVERIPKANRILVTAHDAFGYFGRAYGFEVEGLQGVSTQAEASISDREKLARFIVERRLPAIFIESSVPPRTIEAVKASVAAQGHTVAIGAELFSDSLGDADKPEGTYIGMVKANIDRMVKALAPASPTN